MAKSVGKVGNGPPRQVGGNGRSKADASVVDFPKAPVRRRAKKSNKKNQSESIYAALDLGTNSCRMLVATPKDGHFRILDAYSKPVRLGEGLDDTGKLSDAAITRTLGALRHCARKLQRHGVKHKRLVATEAVRRASNGRDFLRRARNETGINLEVIKPQEEARLAVVSCCQLLLPTSDQVLVVDIGGGSTELVWLDLSEIAPQERRAAMARLRIGNVKQRFNMPSPKLPHARIVDWLSVPFGVATLNDHFRDVEDESARFSLMSWYFEQFLEVFSPYYEMVEDSLQNFQIIGTSGTYTTIGAYHLGLTRYDRSRVDGMSMTAKQMDEVIGEVLQMGPERRVKDPRIGADRASLVISGTAILQTILRLWPAEIISIADRGLREGILYSLMIEQRAFEDD